MNRSLLKQILDQPIDKLARHSKKLPNKEVLRLYREILKFSNEFDWTNEKGQSWRKVIRASARKEFEIAREEKDPLLVLKMVVTSRQAMIETRKRMNEQFHKLNQDLGRKVEQ